MSSFQYNFLYGAIPAVYSMKDTLYLCNVNIKFPFQNLSLLIIVHACMRVKFTNMLAEHTKYDVIHQRGRQLANLITK